MKKIGVHLPQITPVPSFYVHTKNSTVDNWLWLFLFPAPKWNWVFVSGLFFFFIMTFSVSCFFCWNWVFVFFVRPFSLRWWRLLCTTGVWLGVVMSIKYIGVFTVMFVGLHTAHQLLAILLSPTKPLVGLLYVKSWLFNLTLLKI